MNSDSITRQTVFPGGPDRCRMEIEPLRLSSFSMVLTGLSWLAYPNEPPGDVVTCYLRCHISECFTHSEVMVNLRTTYLISGIGDPRCARMIDQALEEICQVACRLLDKPIPKWRLV